MILQQVECRIHHCLRRDLLHAAVPDLRTHAAIAKAARHRVKHHPVRHAPGRVLWIGHCVQIDDGRADRGSQMHRAAVVADEYRRKRQQGAELAQRQCTGQAVARAAHLASDRFDEGGFVAATGP